eukprot:5564650-Amphidinium_carterae.1
MDPADMNSSRQTWHPGRGTWWLHDGTIGSQAEGLGRLPPISMMWMLLVLPKLLAYLLKLEECIQASPLCHLMGKH